MVLTIRMLSLDVFKQYEDFELLVNISWRPQSKALWFASSWLGQTQRREASRQLKSKPMFLGSEAKSLLVHIVCCFAFPFLRKKLVNTHTNEMLFLISNEIKKKLKRNEKRVNQWYERGKKLIFVMTFSAPTSFLWIPFNVIYFLKIFFSRLW